MMRLAKIKVKSQEIISNKNIEVLFMIYFIILIIKIGMILHMSARVNESAFPNAVSYAVVYVLSVCCLSDTLPHLS